MDFWPLDFCPNWYILDLPSWLHQSQILNVLPALDDASMQCYAVICSMYDAKKNIPESSNRPYMLTVTHIYKIYSFPPSLKTLYNKVEFFCPKMQVIIFLHHTYHNS